MIEVGFGFSAVASVVALDRSGAGVGSDPPQAAAKTKRPVASAAQPDDARGL